MTERKAAPEIYCFADRRGQSWLGTIEHWTEDAMHIFRKSFRDAEACRLWLSHRRQLLLLVGPEPKRLAQMQMAAE